MNSEGKNKETMRHRRCFSLRPLLIQELLTSCDSMFTLAHWTSWLQRCMERCNQRCMVEMRSLPLVSPQCVLVGGRGCLPNPFERLTVSLRAGLDCTSCGNSDTRCGSAI
ncbi:hypothetical protein T07_3521 [Trichinella nelsoni]|uniref:Uncharacterized protein n=1 Tax=Trichinella nelsoni TaxID=6336 RepID=A0A0V0SI86_9BILA|nr:hypothetical protein T07_3521 [Trichinella nelsoni]